MFDSQRPWRDGSFGGISENHQSCWVQIYLGSKAVVNRVLDDGHQVTFSRPGFEDRLSEPPTSDPEAVERVNEVLEQLTRRQPPPHSRGREVKLRYGTQVDVAPPSFLIFSNLPKEIPDNYLRYIQNGFRSAWGFQGSPLRIRFKSGRER